MAGKTDDIASTFTDFKEHYERTFGGSLPTLWQDEKSVTLNRRVLINDALFH